MTDPTGLQAMGELGRYFPSGFKANVAEDYLARLKREQFSDADVNEGVQRTIASRTQRTFPSFAELRTNTSEGQSARIKTAGYGGDASMFAPWMSDPRVGSGVCKCGHGLGVHGPEQGGYGEPMLEGGCRNCNCHHYHAT